MELRKCIASELNPPANITLVEDYNGLDKIDSFLSSVSEFGLDIETNMTDHFFDRRIRTIQIGNKYEQYVIDLLAFAGSTSVLLNHMGGYGISLSQSSGKLASVKDMLNLFLHTNKKIKIGHNLTFEYETLKWNLGIRIFGLYDTMLAEKVIYAGAVNYKRSDFWALDDLIARYCGLQISKAEQTTFNLTDPLTSAQIEYAGLDPRFPCAIKGAQVKVILERGLQRTIDIENDAIPAFCDMHLNGVMIDLEKWRAALQVTYDKHKINIEEMDKFFLPIVGEAKKPHSDEEEALCEKFWREESLKAKKDPSRREQSNSYKKEYYRIRKANADWVKHAGKCEGKANIEYGSPAQLLKALQKSGLKIKSTNDEVLETLEGTPIIDAVREYRETNKTINSYGEAYIKKNVNLNTGRVHPITDQLGAETGRTSSRKPNMQNIDRKSYWRECFVARPGRVIITVDYSACELRILAEVSGEQVWIDAFNAGWDVHSVSAEILYGQVWKDAAQPGCAYYEPSKEFPDAHGKCKCKEHKRLRDYIKAINFGIAYGMEAAKLARKLKIEKSEAQELLARYRRTFAAVTAWLEKAGREAQATLRSLTLAGRYRLYPKPDWALAKQWAGEDCEKEGKILTNNTINRKYKGMYASIEREGKNSPIQGCIAGSSRIFDKKYGYVPIQDLSGKDVEVWDGERFSKATVMPSGFKKLVKIELFGGHYIECSPDHKFLTKGTSGKSIWKTPKDFVKQDRIVLTNELPPWCVEHTNKEVPEKRSWNHTPTTISSFSGTKYELGVWLGRLASDGTVGKNGLICQFVAEHEDSILKEITELTGKFDLPIKHNVRITEKQPKQFHSIGICSVNLRDELYSIGIKSSIPKIVLSSTDCLKGYLRGMFDGDGTVSKDGIVLTFGRGKELLSWAREIQESLLLLGIRTRLTSYDKNSHNRVNLRVITRDCQKFCEIVGFINKVKQEKALLVKDKRGKPTYSSVYGMAQRVKKLIFTEELVEMYDVVNSETHKFMSNGIVTHNSNADMVKRAVGCGFDVEGAAYMWQRLEPEFDAYLLNIVHDECVVEAWEHNAKEVFDFVCDCMFRGGNEFLTKIKAEVEGHIMPYWSKG